MTCALVARWIILAGAAGGGFEKGPYLQNLHSSGVTVLWETTETTGGKVEYGEQGFSRSAEGKAVEGRVHEATLAGLKANTVYCYRVVSDGATSPEGTFRTALPPGSDEPFVFGVYGDTQKGPDKHRRSLVLFEKRRVALVLHCGDVINDYGKRDPEEWTEKFFEPARDFIRNVPVFTVPGNHDGADGKVSACYLRFFSLPRESSGNEFYYSFDYGNVHFVGLASKFADGSASVKPGSPQIRWLAEDLRKSKATWKICYFHMPGHGSGKPEKGHDAFDQTMIERDVDLAFTGHDHTYERLKIGGKLNYIISGGGSAELTPMKRRDPDSLLRKEVHHVCIARVEGRKLTVEATDHSGNVFDRVVLQK